VERLEDPIAPVSEILVRVPSKQLMSIYKVASFEGVDGFLQQVASARGKLKRGGVVDVEVRGEDRGGGAGRVMHKWRQFLGRGRGPFVGEGLMGGGV